MISCQQKLQQKEIRGVHISALLGDVQTSRTLGWRDLILLPSETFTMINISVVSQEQSKFNVECQYVSRDADIDSTDVDSMLTLMHFLVFLYNIQRALFFSAASGNHN